MFKPVFSNRTLLHPNARATALFMFGGLLATHRKMVLPGTQKQDVFCTPGKCGDHGECSELTQNCTCGDGFSGTLCERSCSFSGDSRDTLGATNAGAGRWLNVFINLTFLADSVVTGVEFYAMKLGVVYVSFWRKSQIRLNWTFIDSVSVNVSNDIGRIHMRMLPEKDYISVKQGDAIGIYYPTNAKNAVIPYEWGNRDRTPGIKDSDLSTYHQAKWKSDDLYVGGNYNLGLRRSGAMRTAAVKVFIQCD